MIIMTTMVTTVLQNDDDNDQDNDVAVDDGGYVDDSNKDDDNNDDGSDSSRPQRNFKRDINKYVCKISRKLVPKMCIRDTLNTTYRLVKNYVTELQEQTNMNKK
ncbi:unnamed protein product [Enterobius vermicularis]|uniref:BHLH domain-containing protein n=1 Tax=Enterobius vermicularis TaxID=51028 RepID=A0A0N4V2A4_ENTVE|nr:unnamed protein product [Enterobius vermicularis]